MLLFLAILLYRNWRLPFCLLLTYFTLLRPLSMCKIKLLTYFIHCVLWRWVKCKPWFNEKNYRFAFCSVIYSSHFHLQWVQQSESLSVLLLQKISEKLIPFICRKFDETFSKYVNAKTFVKVETGVNINDFQEFYFYQIRMRLPRQSWLHYGMIVRIFEKQAC